MTGAKPLPGFVEQQESRIGHQRTRQCPMNFHSRAWVDIRSVVVPLKADAERHLFTLLAGGWRVAKERVLYRHRLLLIDFVEADTTSLLPKRC